jgi:hypothetical protein
VKLRRQVSLTYAPQDQLQKLSDPNSDPQLSSNIPNPLTSANTTTTSSHRGKRRLSSNQLVFPPPQPPTSISSNQQSLSSPLYHNNINRNGTNSVGIKKLRKSPKSSTTTTNTHHEIMSTLQETEHFIAQHHHENNKREVKEEEEPEIVDPETVDCTIRGDKRPIDENNNSGGGLPLPSREVRSRLHHHSRSGPISEDERDGFDSVGEEATSSSNNRNSKAVHVHRRGKDPLFLNHAS